MMNNRLMMTIWDVQHGNAIYINTPNDKHVVIDLGIGDYSGKNERFSPLEHLKNRGIRQLDHVTITHPHLDHIDDIMQFDVLEPKVLCTTRLHAPIKLTTSGRSKLTTYFAGEEERFMHV